MKKTTIKYTLKKYLKSKSIKLKIKPSGQIQVTAPWFVSKKKVDEFVQSHSDWIIEQRDRLEHLPKPLITFSKASFKKNKAKALEMVLEKIIKINQHYKYTYSKISIRNQKTRWGSCSSKKNLSFNYKIVFLTDELVDYIITHELCHLKEMNHGKNFWELIEKTIPNYKELHLKLKNFKM